MHAPLISVAKQRSNQLLGRNGIGNDTMGWQIMGTEHLKPNDPTVLSDEELAERAIDFIEELGYALQPWQATTLRAMLTYPVGTRFAVDTTRKYPSLRMGMVKVLRDGEWVWETSTSDCQCIIVNGLDYDWRCSACGLEHKALK